MGVVTPQSKFVLEISRLEGLFLIGLYVLYVAVIWWVERKPSANAINLNFIKPPCLTLQVRQSL